MNKVFLNSLFQLHLMTIYYITGASGVGKTTIVEVLKSRFKENRDIAFYHFDSIGVPSDAEKNSGRTAASDWQETNTHMWIRRIVKEKFKTVVIEGQCNLEFIKDGFARENWKDYKIILLECSEGDMKERLVLRNQEYLFSEDMINWLGFLSKQAEKMNAFVINTSQMSVQSCVDMLSDLICGAHNAGRR